MIVTVHNGSGLEHNDMFNGTAYTFPVNGTVSIPAEAAMHIFGMGLKNRMNQITRLGWAHTFADIPAAMRRLDAFTFEVAPEEEVEEVPQPAQIERPTTVPHPKGTDALSVAVSHTTARLSSALRKGG